ncbi:MAG TPA: protein-tyrosine phosphatase family protein [Planctomycetota bacterium]|jgi:protein-tyrosine phosphatase|nr:protein-tyrosine phosphatase family protein [Planctomycetota bacterium]
MRTEIYWIETIGPGRLGVMPRPRGGDGLEDEVQALKKDGVDIVVSLLTPEEEAYLGLEREGETARRHGLTFYSHPVWDRGIPENPAPTWTLARELAGRHAEGRSIVAHCRMGIGRSPLMLASILVLRGSDADQAWAAISAARGCLVPDTVEQRTWLSRTGPRIRSS